MDYHNLAKLYAKEGKDAQAKTLYQQALAIQEKTLAVVYCETMESTGWRIDSARLSTRPMRITPGVG